MDLKKSQLLTMKILIEVFFQNLMSVWSVTPSFKRIDSKKWL